MFLARQGGPHKEVLTVDGVVVFLDDDSAMRYVRTLQTQTG